MGAKESRVLSHNVHDVRRDNRLVVLAALHLAETQQLLDDHHEELLLVVLVHCARDTTDGPAESIEIMPRPFSSIHLEQGVSTQGRRRTAAAASLT
jgi:hypothetical protein